MYSTLLYLPTYSTLKLINSLSVSTSYYTSYYTSTVEYSTLLFKLINLWEYWYSTLLVHSRVNSSVPVDTERDLEKI